MSIGEYNFQEHMKVVAKENMEEGISIGEERGIERGKLDERLKSEERLSQEREKNIKLLVTKFQKIGMSKDEIIEELKDGFDIEIINEVMKNI